MRLHLFSGHTNHPALRGIRAACGRTGLSASQTTTDPDLVTCLRCRGTLLFFLKS